MLIAAACGPAPVGSDEATVNEDSAPRLPPDGSRERPFEGVGVITEIRGDIVQIDHETIPGFMVAVTMDFPVEDPAMLAGLAPGDRVSFGVQRLGDWRHRIIAIAPAPETPE